MRQVLIAMLSLFGASAAAQPADEQKPAQCHPNAAGIVDWQACADTAAPGSPTRSLALINLGSQAYERQDFASAARLYDEAAAGHGQIVSDYIYHAYLADTYHHVGRDREALANAKIALTLLQYGATQPFPAPQGPEVAYGLILPILDKAHDPDFSKALAGYNALPLNDWISRANRAVILDELGAYEDALRFNTQVLLEQPEHPAVLNTQCQVLADLRRGREAIPYCNHALQLAPHVSAIHDTLANALAAAGMCAQAQHEREEAQRLDPTLRYDSPLTCTSTPG